MQRDLYSGEIITFNEVPIQNAGANAKNSMSFARAPLPPTEATRGTAMNVPFWPGGFPSPEIDLSKSYECDDDGNKFFY